MCKCVMENRENRENGKKGKWGNAGWWWGGGLRREKRETASEELSTLVAYDENMHRLSGIKHLCIHIDF